MASGEEPRGPEPLKYQTWALKVSIHCEGCKRKVRRVLQSIDGVYTIDIDAKQHRVTVIGKVDAGTLVRKLVKSGKNAELLPQPKKDTENENPKDKEKLKNDSSGGDAGTGGKKPNKSKQSGGKGVRFVEEGEKNTPTNPESSGAEKPAAKNNAEPISIPANSAPAKPQKPEGGSDGDSSRAPPKEKQSAGSGCRGGAEGDEKAACGGGKKKGKKGQKESASSDDGSGRSNGNNGESAEGGSRSGGGGPPSYYHPPSPVYQIPHYPPPVYQIPHYPPPVYTVSYNTATPSTSYEYHVASLPTEQPGAYQYHYPYQQHEAHYNYYYQSPPSPPSVVLSSEENGSYDVFSEENSTSVP